MKDQILALVDRKKLSIFDHAESLSAARGQAENLLKDSHPHRVAQALDVYHNTLLNEIIYELKELSS